MTEVHHIDNGAAGSLKLVHDDEDRLALLRCVAVEFGAALLGYCIMDTHLHLVVESSALDARARLDATLKAYARSFNARHSRVSAPLLRGEPTVKRKETTAELARTIHYDHKNPVKTTPPIVAEVHIFPWSSAREFIGFTRRPFANVARARALMGDDARKVYVKSPPLVGLEAAVVPATTLEVCIAAVAQTYSLLPRELLSSNRRATLNEPRGTLVELARLESFRDRQLSHALGRTTQRVGQLARHAHATGVRIARTIARTPELRALLPTFELAEVVARRAGPVGTGRFQI